MKCRSFNLTLKQFSMVSVQRLTRGKSREVYVFFMAFTTATLVAFGVPPLHGVPPLATSTGSHRFAAVSCYDRGAPYVV